MTATAAPVTVTRPHSSRALHAVGVAILSVVATGIMSLLLAAAILGAADRAGIDVQVPEPGPVPHPIVAPAGHDL